MTSDIVLAGHQPKETIAEILRFIRGLTDDDTIFVDKDVAQSETDTGFRNRALANYMRAFGNLQNPVDEALGVYFHQCAIAMSCTQLAKAGLFLANGGINPLTSEKVIPPIRVRRVNAIMMTCGHYVESAISPLALGSPERAASAVEYLLSCQEKHPLPSGHLDLITMATRSLADWHWKCWFKKQVGMFSAVN